MRNSESFETIESQILDSATLVSGNGEGSDEVSLGSAVDDLDFEDDGILIMPPDFEDKVDHESCLSLPESVPSTIGSFTAANHNEAKEEDKERAAHKSMHEHEDKSEGSAMEDEMPKKAIYLASSDLVSARTGVTWIGYLCFVVMLLVHILTFYRKGSGVIHSDNPSFQVRYDEALLKVRDLEKQLRDLERIQKENEELRKRNTYLDDLVQSMRNVERKNDALQKENRHLKEKLESSNLPHEEQHNNLTTLMNEVERLTTDVMRYEVRNKVANAKTKKSLNALASLSQERDRLLRKNRRLQRQLKKARKKADQDDGNSNASFPWEITDETKQPIIDNCWLQVDLGDCSKEAKTSLHEGTQKVTESLWKAKETASTGWSHLKEHWKGSAPSMFSSKARNGTGKNDFYTEYYDQIKTDSAEYYDKVQDNIIEFVSNSVESLKTNEHIINIGNTAKSVLAGVVFATAASVIVSSTFVGGIFGDDGENGIL